MEEMKEKAQKLILGDDMDGKEESTLVDTQNNTNVDAGYFNTYSHFAIHHEMLTVSYVFRIKDLKRFSLKNINKYRDYISTRDKNYFLPKTNIVIILFVKVYC